MRECLGPSPCTGRVLRYSAPCWPHFLSSYMSWLPASTETGVREEKLMTPLRLSLEQLHQPLCVPVARRPAGVQLPPDDWLLGSRDTTLSFCPSRQGWQQLSVVVNRKIPQELRLALQFLQCCVTYSLN